MLLQRALLWHGDVNNQVSLLFIQLKLVAFGKDKLSVCFPTMCTTENSQVQAQVLSSAISGVMGVFCCRWCAMAANHFPSCRVQCSSSCATSGFGTQFIFIHWCLFSWRLFRRTHAPYPTLPTLSLPLLPRWRLAALEQSPVDRFMINHILRMMKLSRKVKWLHSDVYGFVRDLWIHCRHDQIFDLCPLLTPMQRKNHENSTFVIWALPWRSGVVASFEQSTICSTIGYWILVGELQDFALFSIIELKIVSSDVWVDIRYLANFWARSGWESVFAIEIQRWRSWSPIAQGRPQ